MVGKKLISAGLDIDRILHFVFYEILQIYRQHWFRKFYRLILSKYRQISKKCVCVCVCVCMSVGEGDVTPPHPHPHPRTPTPTHTPLGMRLISNIKFRMPNPNLQEKFSKKNGKNGNKRARKIKQLPEVLIKRDKQQKITDDPFSIPEISFNYYSVLQITSFQICRKVSSELRK